MKSGLSVHGTGRYRTTGPQTTKDLVKKVIYLSILVFLFIKKTKTKQKNKGPKKKTVSGRSKH